MTRRMAERHAGLALADPSGIDPDLVEETEFGPIPRISSTGVTPFDAYSRPAPMLAAADGKPLLAIVVSGLGHQPERHARARSRSCPTR